MLTGVDRKAWLNGAAFGVVAGLVLSPCIHLAFQAVNGQVSTDDAAAYFSWWYVLGTLFAFANKAVKGTARYLPVQNFSWPRMFRVFIFSIPSLAAAVFIFLPLFGPPVKDPQQNFFKAFFTAHYFIGFGQSVDEYEALISYIWGRIGNGKTDKKP